MLLFGGVLLIIYTVYCFNTLHFMHDFTIIVACKLCFLFADINECADGTANCDQQCINNDGGFECQCLQGFLEDPNTKKCKGIYVCS